jgi:DNA polymerase I-like protein with 3'-5' exonuclease and polymerase domains
MPFLAELFAHPTQKVGWNNENYDFPRVVAQTPVNGDQIDAMLAWHVLNTSLPKGLGYVTPFYVHDTFAWKHLSLAEPAFYNAKDADMALRIWLGVRKDLQENNLWGVFKRHVIEVNQVFNHMRTTGVLRDEAMRSEAESRLAHLLSGIKSEIEDHIPTAARNLKVYKKTPKDTTGMVTIQGLAKVKKCPGCDALNVKAAHFKSIGKKRLKLEGAVENPCVGLKSTVTVVTSLLWALPLEFKISNKSLQQYQKVVKHRPILDPKKKTITFDEKALKRLIKFYPNDKLYPLILKHREVQGLLSKYIGVTQDDGSIKGGLTIGSDGLIHTQFTHNPSTLRSAAQNPPLQQLPRVDSKNPDALPNVIRRLVQARPGMVFTARDYSGIEAVLVGFFAGLPDYIRLAKMDVHSFYTAYALNQLDGRVSSNDLPLLSWSDEKLAARLKEIKKEFAEDRNSLYKHLIHGANFMQGARGAAEKILNETGIEYPVGKVQRVMDIYFELFPGIRSWHHNLMAQADKDGYLRNPFGYVHRFNRVYEYERVGNGWKKEPGPEANKVIAFLPQSTAAGMIKEAMLRIYFNHYEAAGQFLRLLVHDELFLECPEGIRESVDSLVAMEMERPVPELPISTTENLVILTEAKYGYRWGDMK